MIQRRSTFFLGIFIFIVPFMGVPSSWRTAFILISGLLLVVLSIKITLPKKNIKTKLRRERTTPVFVESIPTHSKENTVDGIIAPDQEMKTDVVKDFVKSN